ncbi:uncharacterized protein LOC113331284 [Papaver somniferum]|uniref:uncharacterized protein LOC113331284 n=1 Tax=Papaver somniferum TaxID=3469 RepID=UPI000E705169|nr:uncharacterized protein LOC113331284 [Papaver somniferum]
MNLAACIMWNIWKSRNDLIFNNISPSTSQCIQKTLQDFHLFDLHHALNYCSDIDINQNNAVSRELPPSGVVKVNVDASFNNGNVAAAAAAAVDSYGNHLGSGSICFHTISSTVAEAKAYGLGIQLADRLQVPRIIMEGDASDIPKAIKGNIQAKYHGVFVPQFSLSEITSRNLVKLVSHQFLKTLILLRII